MADRGSGREGSPVQDVARLQDRGASFESLARDAHIRAQLRGDADLDGVGRLSDARRVVRVLDFHDGVGAFGDRRARHDAPSLPLLESILAGVARRNVARDGQSPRALALEVLATHREPVHRGVCKWRQGDQRGNVDRQAAPQALLDGERVVGEDVAERQRLDQLAMLRGRQGGIMHVTSVGPGGVGQACGALARRSLDEARAGAGGCGSFQRPGYGSTGELHYMRVRHAGDTPLEGFV